MSNHLSQVSSALIIPKVEGVAATSTLVAEGTHVSALSAGEFGVFSAIDNNAVDATPASPVREFYIAYKDSAGKIWRSAGQKIDMAGITAYNGQCYSPSRAKIVDVNLGTLCQNNTQMYINVEAESQYFNYGFQPVRIPIVGDPACCDTCDCTDVNCKDVAVQYADAINAHPDGLFEARIITAATSALADPTSAGMNQAAIDAHDGDIPDLDSWVLVDHYLLFSLLDWQSKKVRIRCSEKIGELAKVNYSDAISDKLAPFLPSYVSGREVRTKMKNGDFIIWKDALLNDNPIRKLVTRGIP